MEKRYKNIVTILFLAAMVLPFVLITQLYPFFRMGMFAEPIRNPEQAEKFALILQKEKGRAPFPADSLGLTSSKLNYLLRNHYYRQEHKQALQQIAKRFSFPESRSLLLYRIQYTADQKPDSTLITRKPL